MTYPLFITFHYDQRGSHYRTQAQRLRERCEDAGVSFKVTDASGEMPTFIRRISKRCPRAGSRRNHILRWIPTFIVRELESNNRPLLYLHCDTTIVRIPSASDFEDMFVGYSRGKGKYYHKRKRRCYKILSNPIYVRPSDRALSFLREWQQLCESSNLRKGEHYFLQQLCEKYDGIDGVRQFPPHISSRDPSRNVCFRY